MTAPVRLQPITLRPPALNPIQRRLRQLDEHSVYLRTQRIGPLPKCPHCGITLTAVEQGGQAHWCAKLSAYTRAGGR